jgi:hypothetical protein
MSHKDDEEAPMNKNSKGMPVAITNSSLIEFDVTAGILAVIGLYTEATLLLSIKERALALASIFFGLYGTLLVGIAYAYRMYSRKPTAGKTIYAIGLIGMLAGMLLIGIWKFIAVIVNTSL